MDVVTAALAVEVVTVGTLLATGRGGTHIRQWYRSYGASAAVMDVLSATVGAATGMAIGGHKLARQVAAAVVVTILHDLVFGHVVERHGRRGVLKLFKQYAAEVGGTVLVVDVAIVLGTLLAATVLRRVSYKPEAILPSLLGYTVLLLVHSM